MASQLIDINRTWQRLRNALSPREAQIAALIVKRMKNKDIAETLKIGEQTVKNHVHDIFNKTGCESRNELAAMYHYALLLTMDNILHPPENTLSAKVATHS